MPRGGWPLVALAATGVALMVAAILGVRGVGEEGVRACVRATARSSALLFLGAFVASMLRRRWRNPFTGWLIRNRRYLGVSFAASHAIHLGALVALLRLSGERREPADLAGGALAYLFIAAMTATSTDRTAAWLGPRWWHRLHSVGAHYVWLIFVLTFGGRAASDPIAALFTALLVLALAARLLVPRRRARPASA